MTPHTPLQSCIGTPQIIAAQAGALVIENLDAPSDQSGALFTVTYTHVAPAVGDHTA
ncbi:hypothetical protein [Streptomyces sp. NPDC088785]|uniref:hypothetical protein n=1 Tax=Streptomyces sp. NPDC088785 TaxID=3365897 RepID=UPI0037FCC987